MIFSEAGNGKVETDDIVVKEVLEVLSKVLRMRSVECARTLHDGAFVVSLSYGFITLMFHGMDGEEMRTR